MHDIVGVRPIGHVESELTDRHSSPKQGNEGGPQAWLRLDPAVRAGLADVRPGDRMLILTWLHQADRAVLVVHPRDDVTQQLRGVFSTRSSDRPNPIGIHPVEILEVDGVRLRVSGLEAIDGTPVLDLKPDLATAVS